MAATPRTTAPGIRPRTPAAPAAPATTTNVVSAKNNPANLSDEALLAQIASCIATLGQRLVNKTPAAPAATESEETPAAPAAPKAVDLKKLRVESQVETIAPVKGIELKSAGKVVKIDGDKITVRFAKNGNQPEKLIIVKAEKLGGRRGIIKFE